MTYLKHIAAAMTAGAIATSAAAATPDNGPRIIKIDNPKMTVYLPPKTLASGRAIVDLPGGGYSHLATGHEGVDWVPYYNKLGIALAILEYTFPKGDPSLPINDAMNAMKIMRDSASVWNINPHDIGIMGSSAGGHLATTIATHADSASRPDFQILFYPVVTMKAHTHGGSRKNILGDTPTEAQLEEYSNELHVTPSTPRAIMLLSDDDKDVVPANSIRYYEALHNAGVPASMIIFPVGGHGWGYKTTFKYHDAMLDYLTSWLKGF